VTPCPTIAVNSLAVVVVAGAISFETFAFVIALIPPELRLLPDLVLQPCGTELSLHGSWCAAHRFTSAMPYQATIPAFLQFLWKAVPRLGCHGSVSEKPCSLSSVSRMVSGIPQSTVMFKPFDEKLCENG
tara:strand:- start:199 stop:588 length:390 start_codon:yes stop_codon:yes gene_type:complete